MELIQTGHLFIEKQPDLNLKNCSHEIKKQHQKARNT